VPRTPKNSRHSNQFAELIVSTVSFEVGEDAAAPTTLAQEFALSGALRAGAPRAPEQRTEIARKVASKRSGPKKWVPDDWA